MTWKDSDVSLRPGTERVTGEVGSEGGTPGDLKIRRREVGTGSEADELWRPAEERNEVIRRDKTPGRRSP